MSPGPELEMGGRHARVHWGGGDPVECLQNWPGTWGFMLQLLGTGTLTAAEGKSLEEKLVDRCLLPLLEAQLKRTMGKSVLADTCLEPSVLKGPLLYRAVLSCHIEGGVRTREGSQLVWCQGG